LSNGLSIVVGIGALAFAIVLGLTNGFSSAAVASSNVTVQGAAPTVNDDVDRGFLPGHVWVDDTGPGVYIAVTTADGAADWNKVD
jgi:hypothetical protein